MTHVPPSALWTFSCRAEALSEIEMDHLRNCADCKRLLDGIEKALEEIAEEQCSQTVN